jgi:ATP-binding cassette subfamily B multidrug efflux pump
MKASTTSKATSSVLVIYSILCRYWYITLLLAATAAFSVAAGLIPPRIMQTLIDGCFSPVARSSFSSNTELHAKFVHLALWYFASFVLIGVLEVIKETVLSAAGQKIAVSLRCTMMRKMTRLPSAYFTAHESGAIVSRLTNDVESIQSLFTNGVIGMIVDLLKVAGIVVSMWMFSSTLGIFMLCILPLIYVLTRFFQKRMLGAQKKKRIIVARITGFVPETVRNIRMIHSFGKEEYMKSRYGSCIDESYRTIEKINIYDSIYSPIIKTISSVIIAAAALLASAHLPFAFITAGIAAASIQYITDIFTPIGNLGMELQSIQSAVAGISRVDEFLAEQEEIPKDENKTASLLQKIRAGEDITIELRNVTFSYSASSERILDNVSLVIPGRAHITFAGRTGAGKSTLFGIFEGLLTPQSGSVLIGGTDVSIIPNTDKRRIFGYVTQRFDFIPGTVADQITMGDSSIPRSSIEEALSTAGMKDYVTSLEKGIDTPADPTLFSQGQMQLLSVARAVVTRPPVLLLDEITANLDSATEKKLLEVLENAGRGRTVLSISHRLSASLASDKIITISGGRLN